MFKLSHYGFLFFLLIAPGTYAHALSTLFSGYDGNGLNYTTDDSRFSVQVRGRTQFRFAAPGAGQPNDPGDFIQHYGNQFDINRARIKVNGHAYKSWIKYAVEYDAADNRTLNATIALEKYAPLNLKAGQWKVEYSRERSVSSGGQQMMDRSIINRIFTLDRQQGISLYGHIDNGGAVNVNYWAGVFTGSGRGEYHNHDGNAMYASRLQWNLLGKKVGFKNSDLQRTETPEAAIAIAGAKYRSIYTRFSSSGPGALNNIDIGETPGQYDVKQFVVDGALFYQGFNGQAEYHEKDVTDRVNGNQQTTLRGYYVQAGYFLNEQFSWWPAPLELAARYATYKPDVASNSERFSEQTLALNWFFNGHKNKVTAEISEITMQQRSHEIGDRLTWRLQWDVSF